MQEQRAVLVFSVKIGKNAKIAKPWYFKWLVFKKMACF